MQLEPDLVAALRDDLLKLESDMQALLTATEAGARPVQLKDNKGRLSRMAEMHDQSILLANRNVTQNRLKRVKSALRRLDEGTFGLCADCEETIATARLKAYPDATLCLDCQSERESG